MTDRAQPRAQPRAQTLAVDAVDAWVFDLDNTLYDASTNLFAQIDRRMTAFIADFLGVSAAEAHRVQKSYFREFGTTLRGLMQRHAMEPGPFLHHVHDIDVSVLPPSPALDAALGRLAGRKIIFTNGSEAHARRVMDRLGVGHHFDAVIDIAAADYLPKPHPDSYRILVERQRLDPRRTVMVEDIARNLEPAHALGMTTVWLRTNSSWAGDGDAAPHVHHVIDDLLVWLEGLLAPQTIDSAGPNKHVPAP